MEELLGHYALCQERDRGRSCVFGGFLFMRGLCDDAASRGVEGKESNRTKAHRPQTLRAVRLASDFAQWTSVTTLLAHRNLIVLVALRRRVLKT